jgi:hypothetical protein
MNGSGVPVLIQYCYVCARGWHLPNVPDRQGNTAKVACPVCGQQLRQTPADFSGQVAAHPAWMELWFSITPKPAPVETT